MSYPFSALSVSRPLRSLFAVVITLAFHIAPVHAQLPTAVSEVRLVVTVTDGKGRYLTGLEKSRFSVFEGKDARAITSFEAADAPASVGVVVDVSESMTGRGDEVRAALGQLVLKGHPESRYFIAVFNTQVRLLADWTNQRAVLEGAIHEVGAALGRGRTRGYTSLYDACASVLAKLAEGPHAKRVLVVVSDGMDTHSRTSPRELRSRMLATGVLVYSLGPAGGMQNALNDAAGRAVLADVATRTGGAALFPESHKEAGAAGEWIAADLRNQYVVGFAPAGAGKKGELIKVRVKIEPPPDHKGGLRVRSREGYLTPE